MQKLKPKRLLLNAFIKKNKQKSCSYPVDKIGNFESINNVNRSCEHEVIQSTAGELNNQKQRALPKPCWTPGLPEGFPLDSVLYLNESAHYQFTLRPPLAALDKHRFTQRIKTWESHRYLAVPTLMSVAQPALNEAVKPCLSSAACQQHSTGAALLANLTSGVRLAFSLWAMKTSLSSRWGVNFDFCCTLHIKTRPRAICFGANITLNSLGANSLAKIATERRSCQPSFLRRNYHE